jgi:L-threonylcarbamoyladenylate synthase
MGIISNCTALEIDQAADALIAGNLVAFPTETVYGLGGDASNEKAVEKIYKVKGRPTDHPLIVHISDINYLDRWAREVPKYAIELARAFWPGPMTLILPRTLNAKNFITGGQDSVGIRIPNQIIALKLLSVFEKKGGMGIAAPSANRFGAVSPTSVEAVEFELGNRLSRSDLILDGGICQVGVESTIIDCTSDNPSILRPGAVTISMIQDVTDLLLVAKNIKLIKVSGNLESHYAPIAQVLLNQTPNIGDGLIALSDFKTPPGVIRLASPNNSEEYAKVLYQSLREGDRQKINRICVMLPTGDDIALAVRDRLEKAAHNMKLRSS